MCWGRLLLLASVVGCTDAVPEGSVATSPPRGLARLILGVTPYYSTEALQNQNAELAAYLGRQLALPTDVRVAGSYAELSEWLSRGAVQVADLSPFGYIRAKREQPGIELLAIPIAAGSVSYPAHIVTHEMTGITSVAALRGKRFAFVDRQSASGYLYPLAYLRNLGYEPDRFFSSVQFAGNHEALVDMLEFGRVDAGATFAMSSELAKGKRLRVLAHTGRIPLNAYCAAAGLEPALLDRLRRAFLALSNDSEEGRRVLAATPLTGFASVHDSQYDEVRRVAQLVEEQALGAALGPAEPRLTPPPTRPHGSP